MNHIDTTADLTCLSAQTEIVPNLGMCQTREVHKLRYRLIDYPVNRDRTFKKARMFDKDTESVDRNAKEVGDSL